MNSLHSGLAVLDFGSQYSFLIVRRLRELEFVAELFPFYITEEQLTSVLKPTGIILSGGPRSVSYTDSPHVHPSIWSFVEKYQIPVMGICYGLHELVYRNNGRVESSELREFGLAKLTINTQNKSTSTLLQDVPNQSSVWMSHGDCVQELPLDFQVDGSSQDCEYAIVSCPNRNLWGLQFHPEVSHTVFGLQILKNFADLICHTPAVWNMGQLINKMSQMIVETVKDNFVIGALSGGVDSIVAAHLVYNCIGSKFIGVFIDNGLLRLNEKEDVVERLTKEFPNMRFIVRDSREKFLSQLDGVSKPEEKRKIIGKVFIEEFQTVVSDLKLSAEDCFLLQGTLYTDVIESISHKGPSQTIKTHHNVGGLPASLKMRVLEPLRELFKDEVRTLGQCCNIPHESLFRHPFPGPGLAIRIMGTITEEKLDLARKADAILIQELKKTGHYEICSQAAVILLSSIFSVGVMGDQRTYEMVAVLRVVITKDFMTADWYKLPHDILETISSRIVNEVKGINRVCYDISSKPPATIEWE